MARSTKGKKSGKTMTSKQMKKVKGGAGLPGLGVPMRPIVSKDAAAQ